MQDITTARETWSKTRRATSSGAEELLFEPFQVLDHGFVRLIDYMGDDAAVVQAARVSYGRGTRHMSDDARLINYLMRHRHSTPFEMADAKFHVRLPIFVARQWIRHRTASVNEVSARYSILEREFYIPAREHLAAQSSTNRQGRGAVLDGEEADHVLGLLRTDAERNFNHYEEILNEGNDGATRDPSRQGLARELARMNLTMNTYTSWYWKINLHNLLHFLSLRADPHAQYEIRVYARIMLKIVQAWVPLTYQAFIEYRMGAATFSASMLAVLRRRLDGETVNQKNSGLSSRDWEEMNAILGGGIP